MKRFVILAVILSGIAGAQNVDEGTAEVNLAQPPAHLKKSALLEFLARRNLTDFPPTVEALVRQLVFADASPARAFIPRGRSAQASATDEHEPRILIAPHSANKISDRIPLGFENYTAYPGNDYEGRLFFGFAPRTSKGESLSWNRETGRFDFFVIAGMGKGKRPRVLEVKNREDCTKCHQGGGPIWVVPPWSEVVTHDPRRPFFTAPPIKFSSLPAMFSRQGVLLTREQTPRENNVGLAIDTAASTGNRLLQATRVFREMCHEDFECRRLLLVAALSRSTPIITVTDGFQSSYLRKVVTKVGNSGNDATDLDFVVQPLQPLRNLLKPGLNNVPQIPAFLNDLPHIIQHRWAHDGYAFTAHTLPDPTLVGAGALSQRDVDPLTPRQPLGPIPKDLAVPFIFDAAFETLGFTYQDSLKFQSISLQDRMKRLDPRQVRGPELQKLLKQWPPSREAVLAYFGLGDSDASVAVPAAAAPADRSTAATTAFQKHCQSCHANPNGEVPFIPFSSAADLSAFNSGNQQTVEDRLTQRSMPPGRVTLRPTEAEYQSMLRFFTGQGAVTATGATRATRTNHLGVRYQDVQGLQNSYLVTDGVGIAEEGYLDFGRGGRFRPGSSAGEKAVLLAGKGIDGRLYLALENFPHYFLGNTLQLTSYVTRTGFQAATVLAVSRNGALNALAQDFKTGTLATVPLTQEQGPKVTLVHVSAMSDRQAYATASDGNVYRLQYPGLPATKYDLVQVNVTGITGVKWLKTGFLSWRNQVVPTAQTAEGRKLAFTSSEIGQETWRPILEDAPSLREQDFEPNLLDRTTVVLNPWGPVSGGHGQEAK